MVPNNTLGLHCPKTRFFLDNENNQKKEKVKVSFIVFRKRELLGVFRKTELLGVPRHTNQSTKIMFPISAVTDPSVCTCTS